MNARESNIKSEKILLGILEKASKDRQVNIRLTEEQYKEIECKMKKYYFTTISEYLRFVGLNANVEVNVGEV